jgi:uncharacterized glyoxalase superfamily protein PhnB
MRPNRSMPPVTAIPELAYPDVPAAVAWLRDTFGFAERWRAGDHRAQMMIGEGGALVVRGASPGHNAPRDGEDAHAVMVRVDDADAHHAHARERGATILRPPADFPYGERQYTAEDLAGHRWTFSQTIADVAPEDWGGTSAPGNNA